MEAIILAGGFGTRLAHILKDIPKPMAKVAERPFLEILFDQLKEQGVKRFILAVGHQKEVIMDYFGDSYEKIPILYSVEDSPLFTGGAVKKALSLCQEDFVYVINGDTYFNVDLSSLKSHDFTIAVKEMTDFQRYGQVMVDSTGKITQMKEKEPCEKGLINGGIYRLPRTVLEECPACFSLENDFFPEILKKKEIYAVESKGYFIDIGIPEDYYTAQAYFDSCSVEKNSVAFFDRDGTINVNFAYVYEKEKLEFLPETPWYIRGYNHKNVPVVVVTNQAGIAKDYYTKEQMDLFHQHMKAELEKNYGATLDAIYFCPHHPDFTGECDCRKPNTGMFLQAKEDFLVDFSQSVLYGDKESDEKAGKAVGIGRFVLVECEKNV